MVCGSCGEKPKNTAKDFTKAVIEINNPETLVLLRKVVIPASMGDEESVPPAVGKYRNVLLQYEANDHIYLYSSDGIPTAITANIPQEVLDSIAELEGDVDSLQQQIDDLKNSPDVVDIVDTYADLQAYDTSHLGDKDIIRVLTDETHDGASSYYRWDKQTETWTYVGSIQTAANTIFYANLSETGNTRHIYKNSDMTGAVSVQELLDANEDGQVILRMSSAQTPENFNDAYLQNTYVGVSDYQFLFLDNRNYYEYDGTATTDTSYYYSKSTIQLELTAGNNITITGNTISAADTTYSNFTGTDGTSVGAAGLVPAPATTDAGKFLKADGTWDMAGGGTTQLTSADFNYPTENPDGIAIWLLEPGAYIWTANLKTYTSSAPTYTSYYKGTFLEIFEKAGNAFWFNAGDGFYYSMYMGGNGSQYVRNVIIDAQKVKQDSGSSTTDVMSQNAVSKLLFNDTSTRQKVQIGNLSSAIGTKSIAIGSEATTNNKQQSISIGSEAKSSYDYSTAIGSHADAGYYGVALGAWAKTTRNGEVNIGTGTSTYGFNSTNYRVLGGVYDGQELHDAATKGQLDAISSFSETEVDTGATWIDGSHIYKKTIDTGALPNNTTKSVAHNIGATLKRVIKVEGYAFYPQFALGTLMPNADIRVMTSDSYVEITTEADYSQFTESYVTLYYIKNSQ